MAAAVVAVALAGCSQGYTEKVALGDLDNYVFANLADDGLTGELRDSSSAPDFPCFEDQDPPAFWTLQVSIIVADSSPAEVGEALAGGRVVDDVDAYRFGLVEKQDDGVWVEHNGRDLWYGSAVALHDGSVELTLRNHGVDVGSDGLPDGRWAPPADPCSAVGALAEDV